MPSVGDFEGGYARRECVPIEGVEVNVIGFEDLLVAKRAAGRPPGFGRRDTSRGDT